MTAAAGTVVNNAYIDVYVLLHLLRIAWHVMSLWKEFLFNESCILPEAGEFTTLQQQQQLDRAEHGIWPTNMQDGGPDRKKLFQYRRMRMDAACHAT